MTGPQDFVSFDERQICMRLKMYANTIHIGYAYFYTAGNCCLMHHSISQNSAIDEVYKLVQNVYICIGQWTQLNQRVCNRVCSNKSLFELKVAMAFQDQFCFILFIPCHFEGTRKIKFKFLGGEF